VQAALKDRVKSDKEKREADLKQKKDSMRQQEEETKKKIQDSIDRARKRPLLIESVHTKKHNENLAKIKAAKTFI
jgi:hypothetical protein